MLHPAAYLEFRRWQQELLGNNPSIVELGWHWLRQFVSHSPPLAPVRLKSLRHPVFLRPWTSDLYVFEQIFVNREYDTPLRTPTSMIDAGANIGLAAVYFANRFPEVQIVAVEPERENYEMLRINTRRYKNIQYLRAAVWPHSGTLKIANAGEKSWAFRVIERERDDTAAEIPAVSIDEIAEKCFCGRSFDLLKIDIEGAEKKVFEAGGDWIAAANTIIVECHDRIVDGCEHAVTAAVRPYFPVLRRSGEYLIFERDGGTQPK